MRSRTACGALAALAVFCAYRAALPADEGTDASGSLAWTSSDKLDLVGTMAAEIPFGYAGPWRVATSLGAVTAIKKATDFTFTVDRVAYTAELLARRSFADAGALELYAGEQGVALVDAAGSARVRVVGAAWESPGYRNAFGPSGFSGRVSAGIVVEHQGVDAVATASASVRYLHPLSSHPRVALGADASANALFGINDGTDVTLGPRMEFDMGGDRRFALFARWLTSRNPLGLDTDGVLAGFDFAQGLHPEGPREIPPEIAGFAAAGTGENARGLARLDLRVATPPFLGGTYAEVEVDGNVLTGNDVNDLFYLYDVGFAHPFADWSAGLWFHHRSNHLLGTANDTVTSINVLETGVESAGWNRAEPSGWQSRAGAIDARLRVGWLIDSSFGEDQSWHARAGARWAFPALGPLRLYAALELERGDVASSIYDAGMLLPRGWDVRLEVRHDEQLFSADQRAHLVIATLRY